MIWTNTTNPTAVLTREKLEECLNAIRTAEYDEINRRCERIKRFMRTVPEHLHQHPAVLRYKEAFYYEPHHPKFAARLKADLKAALAGF